MVYTFLLHQTEDRKPDEKPDGDLHWFLDIFEPRTTEQHLQTKQVNINCSIFAYL